MLESVPRCPECGADWQDGSTCQDDYNQMAVWEFEDMQNYGQVHHLMVLCFHLQHPSRYSPDGLRSAQKLLAEFVEGGFSPQEARRRDREKLDSGKRTWKIKSRAGLVGSYQQPVHWKMTAADVVARGASAYTASVREWAETVLAELRRSKNFPVD